MKTLAKFRIIVLALTGVVFISCASQTTASANDTSGLNGATNGTGKVTKSDGVHNFNN